MNYVIYHRNNNTLGLSNHIDKDGDLDPNYSLLRNTGLTGNEKRFSWLKECALNGCPICRKIFVDVDHANFQISDWYNKNVVKPQLKMRIDRENKIKTKKSTKPIFLKRKTTNKNQHPLYDYIVAKFTKGEINEDY